MPNREVPTTNCRVSSVASHVQPKAIHPRVFIRGSRNGGYGKIFCPCHEPFLRNSRLPPLGPHDDAAWPWGSDVCRHPLWLRRRPPGELCRTSRPARAWTAIHCGITIPDSYNQPRQRSRMIELACLLVAFNVLPAAKACGRCKECSGGRRNASQRLDRIQPLATAPGLPPDPCPSLHLARPRGASPPSTTRRHDPRRRSLG